MAVPRARHRLLRHHLPILFASTVGTAAVLVALRDADRWVYRWSMATAYVGLALLAATLVPGALAAVRGRRHPASTDLRRDLGIWAGLFSLAHFVVGLQVHMRHRWEYWLRSDDGLLLPRLDLFGIANHTGLAATLLAALLLALSNDRSLGVLGAARWKRLQRWNVALFGLVVLHGAAYQVTEQRALPGIIALAAVSIAVATLRLAGRRSRR